MMGQISELVENAHQWTALTFLGIAFLFLMQWLVRHIHGEFADLRRRDLATQTTLMEIVRLLVMHDAQVRGINPAVADDASDGYRLARDVYERILSNLASIEHAVEQQKNESKK